MHRGDLDDLDGLREAAAAADGVIHLAYRDDFDSDFVGAAQTDLRAIEAMGEELAGSDRPLVITSGTLLLAVSCAGRTATENDTARRSADRLGECHGRAGRTWRAVVGRPAVATGAQHLDHHGFAHRLIDIARDKGVSAYIGDGSNRWPGVHTLDAAHLYRLALETAPAGTRLHGVADEGVPFRDIAAVIGRHLDLPVVSISANKPMSTSDSCRSFGSFDNPTSSTLTQKVLDWHPEGPGLIEDLDEGHYFSD